ncbi:MAG TPA: 4'-phosphopantetheinyl transferase superfamily protein [Vicinamibacterales bacterium]|nr:4'-phosphopantetheinyl transferase superfamily protein [Vicinamibacterales bacterium]
MILVESPAILPKCVAHVSATVELDGAENPEAIAPGIRLPQRLRTAVRSRQVEFLAGRACAERAIARLDPDRRRFVVRTLRSGAPRFPPALAGSITHAAGFVSAAVAHRSDVAAIGIDSEHVAASRRASRVMPRVAAARELEWAVRGACLDRETAITLLFSAKESLFKALYARVGRQFDFLDACIEVSGGSSGSLRALLLVTLSDRARKGAAFDGRFVIRDGFVHTAVVIPPP